MRALSLISLFTFLCISLFGQENLLSDSLKWGSPIEYGLEGKENAKALFFEEAQYDFPNSNLPFLYMKLPVKNGRVSSISFSEFEVETLSSSERQLVENSLNEITENFQLEVENSTIRKREVSYVKILPFRKGRGGQIEKLKNFKLLWVKSPSRLGREKSITFANQSKLSQGEWFKIGVTERKVYKLTYNFVRSLGVDVNSIDPRNISLYGYGGGMLPLNNDEDRPDDLLENPIVVKGESDGSFDNGDYILFFGDDQVEWEYDTNNNRFSHTLNYYEDTTFYFLRFSGAAGKRVKTVPRPTQTPNSTVTSYDAYDFHEEDKINLIQSGRVWVGETFGNQLTYSFGFNFPNLIKSEPASVEVYGVARAGVSSSMTIKAGNSTFSLPFGSTVLSRYEVAFGDASRSSYKFSPQNSLVNVQLTYNRPQSVARAWLNYINVNVRSNLSVNGEQTSFRDVNSVESGAWAEFLLKSEVPVQVWDVTNPSGIEQKVISRNGITNSFVAEASQLREYIAFSSTDSINIYRKGKVSNQNLHGLGQADMVIVTHPKFLQSAFELAEFHSQEGLVVHTVTTEQVYNEFSSGAQDPIATRSLMKMLYDRATSNEELPKYLLLFGDGSFDFKDRFSGNSNYVLAYQSGNFLQPTLSYVTDDFYGFLDDDEGNLQLGNNPNKLDIGIGRFPVQTVQEAQAMVQKVRRYSDANTLNDWRNKIAFVGDDEDGGTHMVQANELSKIVDKTNKEYDLSKIYLDAYQQQSSSGGTRYPDVNDAIDRAVQDGALFLNYTGHGGETGWAAERVLTISNINSWSNLQNMPIFITATCEFSRFDDPIRTSAGELVVLNPNGGGVAMLTTTRLVYSSPNYILNRSFYNNVFDRVNGETKRLGEVFMEVKNENASQANSRNFSLLGDPALKMAIPQYQVITTSINGNPISQLDTLKALSTVEVKGYIADNNGQKLSNFNGLVFPTVFDKVRSVSTLSNDGESAFEYEVRDNRLFKGKATVNNGEFDFSFVVPKDISYSFGNGKISYYADNDLEDANGFTNDIIIGGSNSSALADDRGPQIDLFMNDESFVYGGITDSEPILIANLSDDQGINTVGSGVGHDIIAVLDGNTEETFVLNDFYEAEVDDYRRGKVKFPMEGLSEGKHTLTFKAWDVANNSAEKTIEFNVVEDKEIQIDNLVNYPNPFTTSTEFIFQHNQPGTPLDVKLEIFTVSGKLVKSFNRTIINEGFLSRDIRWNGRDDFGDRIGKGVYVYKLKVRSRNGSVTELFEKLVIL